VKASKEFAKEQGWVPRISFKKTPKITVKLISDEKREITDNTGEVIEGVAIKVEENGEEKEIFTSSRSLIQQLADYEPGETVTIQMKSVKTKQGYSSTFIVKSTKEEIEEEIDAEDLPL